jgi:hypothetical protein
MSMGNTSVACCAVGPSVNISRAQLVFSFHKPNFCQFV